MPPAPVKITFGEMRDSGVRDELIHCCDHRTLGGTLFARVWKGHAAPAALIPDLGR
jgi:hypothetical protein